MREHRSARQIERIKSSVHAILLRYNVDIVPNPPAARLTRMMGRVHIQLVLDVGANVGQFARNLRAGGYRGQILSFEPLEDAYDDLVRAAHNDENWHAIRSALGNQTGSLQINRAANSYSSSLLSITQLHQAAAPASRTVGVEIVDIDTVDRFVASRSLTPRTALLKIDTQGFEREVLAGAERTLLEFAMVKLELSLVELYEGQALYMELIELLLSNGLMLCGVEAGFTDGLSGQMLQFDGLFARSDLLLDRRAFRRT